MTALDLAISRLQVNEGFRPMVYRDTKGVETIGYGFNISAGIKQPAALALLTAQAQDLEKQLEGLSWPMQLDEVRFSVMIELAFNLGFSGLLGFGNMIAALKAQNWQVAHDELLDSEAGRLLPTRYGQLANLLLNGE